MSSEQENINLKLPTILDNEPDWWENFVKEEYPNEKCLEYFKCSRKTYTFLVSVLKPYIGPRLGSLKRDYSSHLRKGVSVEKQIGVLLYKLTSCADYVLISQKFKIHKTTIHKILYRAIIAINKYLLHNTIAMPKNPEAEIIANDFETAHKLPQIIGVMTIVHVPISSPINLNYKFLNTRFYSSFVLQNVIDSNFLFRDVSVRHAGAVKPCLVLSDSNIYKYSEKVVPPKKRNINGVNISYKIVGPKAGPLNSWLINDYDKVTSTDEAIFNNSLKDIRNYADSVIARLRARFLILSHMMDLSYKVAPQIIAACCIIHNICEKEGDPFLDEWLTECTKYLQKYPQPEMNAEWNEADQNILLERDVLRDYISSYNI